MHRKILTLVSAAAPVIAGALVIPALALSAGPTHKNVHFTDTIVGASISSTEAVFKDHSTVGNGAGVQKITSLNAKGGTDTSTVYWGDGTDTTHDTFTFGAPNSQGLITLTGSGHDVSGTGRFKHISSSYTFRGTYDPKTTISRVVLTGTESY
jgi:hypothetical protein